MKPIVKLYEECASLAELAECYSRVDPLFKKQEALSRQEIEAAVSAAKKDGATDEQIEAVRQVLPPRFRHFIQL